MHVDHTDSQKALRRELRAYFSELMTPEIREATRGNEGGATYKQVIRQLGKDGWLALGYDRVHIDDCAAVGRCDHCVRPLQQDSGTAPPGSLPGPIHFPRNRR